MAIGALRAAGIAAAALGYHVWRLLIKQDPDGLVEPQDSVEVLHCIPGLCAGIVRQLGQEILLSKTVLLT